MKSKSMGGHAQLEALVKRALALCESETGGLLGWTGSPAELAERLEAFANGLMDLSEDASALARRLRHH